MATARTAIGGVPLVLGQLGLFDPYDAFVDVFANLPVTSVTFIYVFLPLLVFEAGFATDVRRTLDDAAPILLLAVVATVITIGGLAQLAIVFWMSIFLDNIAALVSAAPSRVMSTKERSASGS